MNIKNKSPEPSGPVKGLTAHAAVRAADQTKGTQPRSGVQSGAQSNALLRALAKQPLSKLELVAALSMKTKTGAIKRCLLELLEQALSGTLSLLEQQKYLKTEGLPSSAV